MSFNPIGGHLCHSCELHINDGDEAVLIAFVKVNGTSLNYRTVDIFHAECWQRLETSDATPETPGPPADPTPPGSA